MATHRVEQGPTGERVAENVAALRADRGMTLAELSALMEKAGRPILPSGLSKIEQGSRRVDADDLVALALALDVTPNRLLLPATARADEVMSVTSAVLDNEEGFWRWATGADRVPIDRMEPDPPGHINLDLRNRFRRENRPHEAPPITLDELEPYEDRAEPVRAAVNRAVEEGVPWDVVVAWVRWARSAHRLATAQHGSSEGGPS